MGGGVCLANKEVVKKDILKNDKDVVSLVFFPQWMNVLVSAYDLSKVSGDVSVMGIYKKLSETNKKATYSYVYKIIVACSELKYVVMEKRNAKNVVSFTPKGKVITEGIMKIMS